MPDAAPTRRQFLKVACIAPIAAPAVRIPIEAITHAVTSPAVALPSVARSAVVAYAELAERTRRLYWKYQALTRAEALERLGLPFTDADHVFADGKPFVSARYRRRNDGRSRP